MLVYAELIAVGLITAILSVLICARLKKTQIVDAPDGIRKHQAAPVSRLGGIGIVLSALIGGGLASLALAVLSGSIVSVFQAELSWIVSHWQVAAFTAVTVLIGFIDDLGKAETIPKLLALLIIAALVAGFGLYPEALPSPWGDLDFVLVLIAGSLLWLLVFTNAVNFMDGANGLAMGGVTIMLIGLMVIGVTSGSFELSIWWFAILGAMAGFLVHNLSGKLYAGDAGALGLGGMLASLSLVSGLNVWTIATLALPFLIDVLLTLVWRTRREKNLLDPHLDHAYQRLIARGWSHLDVAVLYWGLCATSGIAAYIAALGGGAAPFAVFWALLIAGCVLWSLHRRSATLSDQSR